MRQHMSERLANREIKLWAMVPVFCAILILASPVEAQTRIAVLDFELRDLTLDPNTPEEIDRTGSIRGMLEEVLVARGNYTTVNIDSSVQANANAATGYLFDHFDVAAELGKQHGADYILVGRVHKASFLFVYFMVHMVDTRTKQLVGNYITEVKGPQKKLTIKGVESLVEKIHRTLHLK